jgi:hypothetical protein
MSETALDAKKWAKYISDSNGLCDLLRNRTFLKEQVELAMTLYGKKKVNALYVIEALAFTMESDERVMEAVERMPNGNDSMTRKIILHWFAILVYVTARELNLIITATE